MNRAEAGVRGGFLPGRAPSRFGAIPQGLHCPASSGSSLLLKLFPCGRERCDDGCELLPRLVRAFHSVPPATSLEVLITRIKNGAGFDQDQ